MTPGGEVFRGVPVSPGIAIGPVFLLQAEARNVPARPIGEDEVEAELARLDDAFGTARGEVAALMDRSGVGSEVGAIFSTHVALLDDPKLRADIEQDVRESLVGAESAVGRVLERIAQHFAGMDEQFFSSRASDMRDLEERLLRALVGERSGRIVEFETGAVVAAHDLTPSQTADLDLAHTLGFLTDVGGPTSHTAIIARSQGMPAVVGLGDLTSRLRDGMLVVVDGFRGEVVLGPGETELERYRERQRRHARYVRQLVRLRERPAETLDGHRVLLNCNVEFPEEVDRVVAAGGDGVGLFRSEFLVSPDRPAPSEDDHVEAYVQALTALGGRPLTVRTFDFGADKFTPDGAAQEEPNPFLGARSIRLCLERPSLFLPQLRAILRASRHGEVRCLFPMISSLEELLRAKEMFERARFQLRSSGHLIDRPVKIGMMVEIPSAALLCDVLADEVDFLSIGTNDLVQYTLAVDRVNERVAHLYQPIHPALLRLIRRVVKVAVEKRKPVSICGEMAGDMRYTPLLLGMGLRDFSMAPRSLPEVKRVVRSVTVERSLEAAEWCMDARDATEVRERLGTVLQDLSPDLF